MVDLKSLPLGSLTAEVNANPWFGAARKELCCRTGQFADAALYVFDRRILAEAAALAPEKVFDQALQQAPRYEYKPLEQKVIVLGGDYFSQDAYDSVRENDENGTLLKAATPQNAKEACDDALVTETLASIYAQQGHLEQAKEIYSKLILRYPEKNAYFAALIEKLNIINNQ